MVSHISCMHFLIMIDGTADMHAYLGLVPAAHMMGMATKRCGLNIGWGCDKLCATRNNSQKLPQAAYAKWENYLFLKL